MSKLTTQRRNKLKKGTFGLPGERKYPMPDAEHAADAKARATQEYNKGKITKEQLAAIRAKANRILRGK